MNQTDKQQWYDLLERYTVVKKLIIENEELEDEPNTHIQSLNELKGTLDHVMRWMTIYLESDDVVNNNEETKRRDYEKAVGHLKRAFFDAADLQSLLFKKKIVDCLQGYSSTTISRCLPTYYSEIKAQIEIISERLAAYRSTRGRDSEDDFSVFDPYQDDLFTLRQIYMTILNAMGSLQEVDAEEKAAEAKTRKLNRVGYIIGIIGVVVGLIGSILALITIF